MRFLGILRIALTALGRHRMRSALTMLGIVIGVGAVIALVSIGQGAQARIREQMESMGTNVMYVWPQDVRGSGGARGASGDQGSLAADDIMAIGTDVPVIQAVTPVVTSNG